MKRASLPLLFVYIVVAVEAMVAAAVAAADRNYWRVTSQMHADW